MRGRKPSGPALVERLPASQLAKDRLRAILETMAGTCRVSQACQRLHLSEQRFDQLRTQVLQAGLDRLEPRPLGRPAAPAVAAAVVDLKSQLDAVHTELAAAQVREEIALVLPAVHLDAAGPAKKVQRRRSPTSARRPQPR
jgi:hypothetical protein